MSDVAKQPEDGEFIFYQTAEGAGRVEVLYELETLWLNQKRIAELFGVDIRTVSEHLTNVYNSGELSSDATIRKIRRVQTEGNRKVTREIEFYNLDAIISVGYRVNSSQATQFRIWATQTLMDAGTVSAEVAKQLAEDHYAAFRVQQDRQFESDFEREVRRIETNKRSCG